MVLVTRHFIAIGLLILLTVACPFGALATQEQTVESNSKLLIKTKALFNYCSSFFLARTAEFTSTTVTAPLWPTKNLDEMMVLHSKEDLNELLNRPYAYRQRHGRIFSQGYPLTELLAIGPVLFHTLDDFSKTQKTIIDEVVKEAKNPIRLERAREKLLTLKAI